MKIFCLGVAGKAITEKLTEILFYNAHDMLEGKKERQRIKGKEYDGLITTKFERASMASISGIVFDASVMTPQGETKVNYIVRDQDLEGIESVKIHIANLNPPGKFRHAPSNN